MKVAVLFLLFVTVYAAYAVPALRPNELQAESPRFFKFTDEQGVEQVIDLEEEPDMSLLNDISRNVNNNIYLLYTRRNPTEAQQLIMNDPSSVRRSNFNPRVQTVVVVHGWLGSQNSNVNEAIRDAFLGKSDVNVIVLDWRWLAVSTYTTAVRGVPAVGQALGQFLRFLNSVSGPRFDSMHLVGFSLGAHVVGNAGRELNGRVARITALDPAGPLWQYSSQRLNSDDAVYVEAIHTDGDTIEGLGIGRSIADVDFYPNGGKNQPGCLTNVCDHNRAWEFFAASVTYNHLLGKRCSNSLQMLLNTCRGDVLPMGNDELSKVGSGDYRVNTARRYPY